mgnify:CR=1 FL=1
MKGKCPLFGIIEKKQKRLQKNAKKPKDPIFNSKGGVTLESVGNRAQFFLGKSVARLENELRKYGYATKRRPSSHSGSKAKIIETKINISNKKEAIAIIKTYKEKLYSNRIIEIENIRLKNINKF